MDAIEIGLVLFPKFTQLDATGPYEVLARVPGAKVHLVAAAEGPVSSDSGLSIVATTTFDDAPTLDVILIPGGSGVNGVLEDEATLDFVARQGVRARFVTSVCTGALVLGAAGLLRGYRATTHWLSLDLLALFGATPVNERVVVDRNRITGGGVTAGIDFGLRLASALSDETTARAIELLLEYDPAPPFTGGSPRTAEPAIVERVRAARAQAQAERQRLCAKAAARLG